MRFRSSIGSYAVILGLGPVGIALSSVSFWRSGSWLMLALGASLIGVYGWMLLGTVYVVRQDVLDVRLGPFRKRIPLADVKGVDRGRMFDGYMFGVGSDFISVEYGEERFRRSGVLGPRPRGRVINVSPKDADGFVKAVVDGTGRATPGSAAIDRAP